MLKLREHDPVGEDFLTTASVRFTLARDIPASADELFASFIDPAAWGEWLGIGVEWTSEPGLHATRTVTAGGNPTDEYFLVWEPGRRMAFRFDRSIFPVRAFGEDYVITATSENTCRLEWTFAIDGNPFAARAASIAMRAMATRALPKLAKYMAANRAKYAS